MRKLLTIFALGSFSLALAGCDPQIETVCPALKNYSAATQARMAAEYAALPDDIKAAMRDYATQRKMCRALAKR